MADSGSICTKSRWGRELCVAVLGGCLTLLCGSLILLQGGPPGAILWACSRAEVVERCNPWLNLTFTGAGTGEECEWFHHGPWQDKPCCYHDPRDGLGASDVCHPNLVSPADQKSCRTGSRKPEVKIDGITCTISIKDPNSQDVGRYEGSMPYKSKPPHIKLHVDYDDICSYTLKLPCKVTLWLILFACCATVVAVTVLIKFRKTIFPCCYQSAVAQQDLEMESASQERVQIE
jgi:hypothetical protein